MKTSFQFIVLIALVPISLLSQKLTSVEADSIYACFKSSPIADYKESLKIGEQLKSHYNMQKDTCKLTSLSTRIARCHERLGYLDSALQELHSTELASLKCAPKSYLENIIGQSSVYLELENWEKVIDLLDQAEQKLEGILLDSAFYEMRVNKAIALVYSGRIKEAKQVFRTYYHSALKFGDYEDQLTALSNLGALAGSEEDLDSAEYYLSKALKICDKHPCPSLLEILQNLATLASYRDDYSLSKYYLDSALTTAVKQNDLRAECALNRELAMTLMGLEFYSEALNRMFKHSDLKDSVNKKEVLERVAEYQELFDSEKKNRKIKELELEKLNAQLRESKLRLNKNLSLYSGIAVLMVAIGLWSRLRYVKKTKEIIRKEKDRSDELLLNILPFDVAQELKEKGQSDARDFDNVTVLFSDFQSFTETAAQLSAKELVNEINFCFRAFDKIMDKHQVEKIKTIGDAYMAAGGLNVPRKTEVKGVVNAALEMQEFILKRFEDRKNSEQPAFEMRLGIHTGPVVAGIVGIKKFQYDIWGDTVNTANRMESNGAAGKVNISQASYKILKEDSDYTFESRGELEVKGKGKMQMWFISKI
jgi:adenylate cyclase